MTFLVAHSYFIAHDTKQLARMTPYSPLATLIAAAMLRRDGHAVSLFDATFADGADAFEAMLDAARPGVVVLFEDNFNFLTKMCTARRRRDALAMVAAAKARGIAILVNGPDCGDQPGLYLAAGADAVLLGEGEAALAEVAALWQQDTRAKLDGIAGLVLPSKDGGLRRTTPRPPRKNLDTLPLPAWDLVEAHAYRSAWMTRHGIFSWNMATSRGCPYACNWCAKPSFGRGYAQRAPEAVAAEMALLKETIAPDRIWFADDIFGMTASWLEVFAAEVARRGARLPFLMQSRVNLMTAEAVETLAAAGAEEVWLGVESGSQKILDAMDKAAAVGEARLATRRLKARGIRTGWFIQLGYPGESWEDISLTRALIQAERPDDIGVSVAYPLPGTRFHEMVMNELGERRNWEDSDDLAMLFEGTYDTQFYRTVRDVLHEEVKTGQFDDCRWARLCHEGVKHRSANPVLLATGS